MYKNTILSLLMLPLFACSGGGDDSSPSTSTQKTGVFLDSPVINIGYKTETLSGVTNLLGEYNYLPGENVTFFIGDLQLPAVSATGTVTPLDLANTQDISNVTVVNIIRLLQTLDKDGNPNNGITITDAATPSATQVDFSLDITSFASSSAITNFLPSVTDLDTPVSTLINTADAIANFEQELTNAGLKITGVWKLTGRPANAVGGSDLALLTLLPDGTYYFSESNEINEGDGFEYGTYTFSNGTLSVTTTIDTNSNIGFSSIGQSASLAINLNANTFTFPTDDSRESGNYTFTRQGTSSNIAGAWQNGNVLFVFMDNGQYVGHQPTETNNFIGFELGTYTYDGSTLTTSTTNNSDGEALLCNLPKTSNCTNISVGAVINNGSLTFSIPGQGDVISSKKI